mgnify:CR=1 FL=1
MNYDVNISEFEPGILTTIHSEDAFGKNDFIIEICREIREKYDSKPLVFCLKDKMGVIESNIADDALLIAPQYDRDVDEICHKAEWLMCSHPVKIVLVDCLEELEVMNVNCSREDKEEYIKDTLHELAMKRHVSVILMTEHPDRGKSHPELDIEKGSLLDQISGK